MALVVKAKFGLVKPSEGLESILRRPTPIGVRVTIRASPSWTRRCQMEGPRAPAPEEYKQILDFLKLQLRSQYDWSVAKEYPLALSPANLDNIRIIKNGESVLSHAVVRPHLIKTPLGLFKVGMIGSVVTDNQHRNQGLSHQILQSCLQAARDQACDIAILWTDLYDFYRKLGFELAGNEVSLLIDQELNLQKQDRPYDLELKFSKSNRISPEALLRIYNHHTVCTLRTSEDFQKYLEIPNSRLYTAWDEKGILQAYCVEGKGADLDGYIHEWGGSVSKLIPLIAHIRREQKRPITLIAPSHSGNLIRSLKSMGVREAQGYLGMIKILNFNQVANKIKRCARSLGHADFVFDQREGKYFFGRADKLYNTDSESDLVKLIFGPNKPSELHSFDDKTKDLLNMIFPISMWIWGWDSI